MEKQNRPIPRLARGAVIPHNRAFLEVLGDRRSGTNIEAPLSTIEEAVSRAMDARGGVPSEIRLVVSAAPGFARNLKIELDDETKRRGVSLVRK